MVPPTVLLDSRGDGADGWASRFSGFCGEVEARSHGEVATALEEVERAVAGGLHAAGFVTYEAAPGLDGAMRTRPPGSLPLLWFGLFAERREPARDLPPSHPAGACAAGAWEPSMERSAYAAAVEEIHRYIVAGDTYQVNFTTRLRAPVAGDLLALHSDICAAQRSGYWAFIDIGSHAILSASPELFFSLGGGRLRARPMKGTRPRGRWLEEDRALAEELASDPKERAENVMIVDLLRNDLGRVSTAGSVAVPRLWQVERYETVNQLVSQVESEIEPGTTLNDLFGALFPSGSVTGAPKVRTMELIAGLETSPRGIYTGCIGYLSPGEGSPEGGTSRRGVAAMEACFSVAIRTVCVDRARGQAEYGVGSGVTHYSSSAAEFEECRIKARVLTERRPPFDLFETLRLDAGAGASAAEGYFLRDRHVSRLLDSAAYFGFACDGERVLAALEGHARGLRRSGGAHRVRLVLSRTGEVTVGSRPLVPGHEGPLRAGIARDPVSSDDVFLYHKTTNRQAYEDRLSLCGAEEVLLWNERGELTEASIGNVVVVSEGGRWTPPRECGLLAGTCRNLLLEQGEIEERVIPVDELERADELFLINSVRGWVPLELAGSGTTGEASRELELAADMGAG